MQPAAVNRPSVAGTHAYGLTIPCLSVTCALLPFYTVRWHYGSLPTTLLETAILITVAVFALESFRHGTVPDWRSPLALPAALFVIAGGLSVIVAPDHRAALGLYRAHILEPIAVFVVAGFAVRNWRQARLVLLGLGVAAAIVAVPNAYVVLQAIRHHTLNVTVAPPVVIYQTANAVALFLVPLVAVAASLAIYTRDGRDRLGAAVVLMIALPATILSFSRGGYLALLVIGLLLALSHPMRRWFVPAILLVAAALTRLPPIARRLAAEVNLSDPNNSLEERFRLWGATLRMLRDHPIFGTGISGFARSIGPYRNGVFTEELIYPHNILLNFWTETGLLGLAAIIWVVVQAARMAWSGWRGGDESWRALQLGVLLMLVGVIVHGLVDVPYFKNDLSVEFWMLLALSWAGCRWAGQSGRS